MLLQLWLRFVFRVRISFSRALMISSRIPVDALWSILLQTSLSLLPWLQGDRWNLNFIPFGYFFDFLYANNNCLCLLALYNFLSMLNKLLSYYFNAPRRICDMINVLDTTATFSNKYIIFQTWCRFSLFFFRLFEYYG